MHKKLSTKILSHLLLVCLLVGAISIVLHASSENASAAPDTHVWDGGGADAYAGTHLNWVSDIAPTALDSVVFDAGALNCTWNLSITLNAFSMNVGYTGVVTVAGSTNWGTTEDITINAGTFTSIKTSIITCEGNFIKTGGSVTDWALRLVMTKDGKNYSTNTVISLFSLTINGNIGLTQSVTLGGDVAAYLVIATGKTLIISSGKILTKYYSSTSLADDYSNSGIMGGSGTLLIYLYNANKSITFGIVNCLASIQLHSAAGASRSLSLGTNTTFGSALTILSNHASFTITLDISASNYALSATDITIGTRGILNGSASAITSSGNVDFSAGTFYGNTSKLIMTGAGKTIKTANTNGAPYDLQISGTVSTLSSLNVSHNLTVDNTKTLTIASGNTLTLGAGGNASISGNVISAGNWDSSNATSVSGSGSIYVTGADSFYKSNGGGMASNLIVNGTNDRLITASGRLANSLTVNSAGSASLQNDSYVLNSVVNSGTINQNGKRLNITGSSTTPLTGYGTFDGELALNGSTALSYQVQTGMPMGYLFTDRNTKINLDSVRYLQVVPSNTEFINVSIKSYGTEGYVARWSATSTGAVTYSLIGVPNVLYDIWVDHTTRVAVVQASVNGLIQFTYNGPYSAHEFTVSTSGGVSSTLQASFEYTIQGSVVTFTDKSMGMISEWLWNFGDGKGSTSQSPSHRYERAGTYTITLIVYDSSGKSSTAKTQITLELGPDFPIEPSKLGWNIFVSEAFILSVSAIGLLFFGIWFFMSSYFQFLMPILTPRFRRGLGVVLIVIGIFWVAFVDNSHNWFGWGSV